MSDCRGKPVFRFAPSPNGYLHRGHAFSALLNARAAERTGGRLLLRIEDIDPSRDRPEYAAAIFEDLAWLGLTWEEPVLRQSERFDVYRDLLRKFDKLGLLYPAFLSRTESRAIVSDWEATGRSWPRDPDGTPLYPGPERNWPGSKRAAEIATGRPYVLRLDMAAALAGLPQLEWREGDPRADAPLQTMPADPAGWGDVVLARAEVPASYHLAVVVDDAFQQISHVVRGADLRPATAVHRVLQCLLELPEPLYFHHPLVLDESGRKLAKSRGSVSLRQLRAAGVSASEVISSFDGLEFRGGPSGEMPARP